MFIPSDGLPVSQYHGMKNGLSGLGNAGTKHPGVSNELTPNARLATQRKGPVRSMSTCAAKPGSAQDGSSARREKGAVASAQSSRKLAFRKRRKRLWVRLLLLPFLLFVAAVGWVLFYFGSKKAEAED